MIEIPRTGHASLLNAANLAIKGLQLSGEIAKTTAKMTPALSLEAVTWAATLAVSPFVIAHELRNGTPQQAAETPEAYAVPAHVWNGRVSSDADTKIVANEPRPVPARQSYQDVYS